MARYRIHVPLQGFDGAKSGRTYTCSRGATFEAPEGDFKALKAGSEYSRIDDGIEAGGEPDADEKTADSTNPDTDTE